MIVPHVYVMVLASILFIIGMVTMVARKNLIMMLLGLEVMLNAAALAFIGTSLLWKQLEGQVIALFILAVAAVEVSIGLALIVCIYRQTSTVDPRCVEENACILE